MLISIITVCFNSERTIRDTIESMLRQNYPNYEYIIIDGASTDRTLDIINEYVEKFKGKMRVFSEKDTGIYDAMNKGIRLAKGEVIGFINSDDWYEENALNIILKKYIAGRMQILYGMEKIIVNNKEKLCWIKHHEFLEESMITFPTCFISKSVYDKFGGFDLKYKSAADYDFMLRVFYTNEVQFCPLYEVISNFRLGGISGTNIGNIENAMIRNKYGILSTRKMNIIIFINKIKIRIKKIRLVKWCRNIKELYE